MLRNRYALVVAAVLVAAAVPGATAALRGHSAAPALQERSATGFARSIQGGANPNADKPHAGVAKAGGHPSPVRLTKPVERHLKKAGSAVFDVRSLKSVVVKRERPERTSPFDREHEGAASRPSQVSKAPLSTLAAAPAPDSAFDGLDFASWGQGHPPDENGDVGPNYYIQTVNVSIGIFDKSSGNRVAAFTFNSFMSQGHFGNLCDTDNFGDPVVVYDSFEDRWIITDFAFKLDGSGNVNPPHAFQCFAVSKTGDPVTGGWNYYSIEAPGGLGDYPKFGVWSDGLYMSANMFPYAAGGTYTGFHMWAFNKQQMYAGAPTVQVVDFAGDTSDFTVIPANARLQAGAPPAGSPEYFVSTEQFLNAVSVYKFHVDWDKVSTSTFTGPSTAAAAACWPNSAVANALTPANAADTLSIRAMAQAQYSNLGGAESLWVDHTVNRGEFTIANCGGTNTNNATIRWYQANVTGGTVAANLVQGATFDPDGANTFFRFMPSLAVDHSGDLAVGYTKSNATTNPQIKYAGRLAGDAVNTLPQSEQTLINGSGAQSGNCGPSACTRWGDYSGMALDPNGCEFWMTGEYYATTGLNDQTRIGSFHYPNCTTVGNGTLSGTVTDGTNAISGATITLGSRTTTTNGSGAYSFSVPAGTYASLTADKPGFNQASAATIAVPSGGNAARNFTLNASAQSGCFTDNSQSTFQRGAPTNCDLTASPGNVVLANVPAVDQQNTAGTTTGTGTTTNTTWAGQTFTAGVSGQLTKVDFQMFCNGCTSNPNLTVSIRATSAGSPTGSDIASATIPGDNSGATDTFVATFASPPTLTAGTQYALIVRTVSSPGASGGYFWIRSSPSTYAGGLRVTSANSGATWTQDSTRDGNFHTYMSSGFKPSGTFVSSLKDANPTAGATAKWTSFSFTATTPAGTAVKFQLAASNSQYGPFTFVGPDGTAGTFFTTSPATAASLTQFDGKRYLRYEAFLSTTNGSVTPSLSSVQVCFTDAAATAPTSIAVTPATGTFGGTTNLAATLTSGGSPVGGKSVSFTLNGNSVGSAPTNASGVASLSNVSLSGIGVGSYPSGVGAAFAGDPSFDPSNNTGSLTVGKADQTISFGPLADKQTTDPPFTVSATGGASGNPVSFSTASTACSVSGTTVTILSNGTCAIDANQAGDTNYNAAPQVTQSFSIGKSAQTITFPAIADFSWSGGSATLAATASSGLPVSYSVISGPCSVTGSLLTATHAGKCVAAADQAGNGTYSAAQQQTQNATVTKADQTINVTEHAPGSAVFNTQFTVAATGGGSGNAVTFSSANGCTNSGATFTMTSGTTACSVRYDQAGDSDYNPATQVVESVTAQKADQTVSISQHAPTTAKFNDSFGVQASAPGGVVGFTSSGACSNTGNTFTMTSGSGTCVVHYNQGGSNDYNAAPEATESVTAQKADQTITVLIHAPSTAAFNDSFGVSASGGGSASPVIVSTTGVCTNSGASVTMTSGSGTCTVHYNQAGDANFNPATEVTENVTATKVAQTISVTQHAPGSAVFGTQFSVAATGGGSGNAVTFSSAGGCSNTGATFTMTSGTTACSVRYDQAGDANYAAATQVVETVNANKADQTINVTTHAPGSAVFNSQLTVAATGGGSGNAVTFSSSGSCSNTGATFTMTSGTGTCSVKYDQAADGNYNAAPQVIETVNASKADQTITVTTHAPASAGLDSSFGVAANAPGGVVTFTSEGVCSNSGSTFTMTSGTGTCSVHYDQAGDANYNAAPQVTESVTAAKGDQAINVTTHAPGSAAFNSQFTVAATGGGSGNPVTFSSSGSCSNTGAAFTITSGTGTCSVKYDQAGDANYNPATQVTETVNASKAAQTIDVTQHAPGSAVFNTQFTVAATGGASGNPVTFSSANGCTNSGATFTMTSGTTACSVRYDQAGDANYAAASQVVESVTAQKASQTIGVTTHAPATKAYGGSFGVAANAPGGVVVFSSAGNCSNSGSTFTMTSGTGTCTVYYDQAGSNDYNPAPQVTESTDATAAALTITANDRTKTQGTTLNLGTTAFSTGGLVGSDGISRVTLTSAGADAGAAAGPYPIVASDAVAASGTSLANYTIAYVNGTLTVTAATGNGPKVTITRPADGDSFKLGQAVFANYKCAPVNSVAVASCVGDVPVGSAIDTSTVGSHAFTVVGTDVHGNTTSLTHHYTIRYAWQGFFSIADDSTQVLNLVHAGDLIKLSFSLGGNQGLAVLAGPPASVQVACPVWSPQSVKAAAAGTPTGLFFDATSSRYGFGWQTSSAWAGSCRQFQLQTNDGTPAHTATFQFFQ